MVFGGRPVGWSTVSRRVGRSRESGAGSAEYAALMVLAALILGDLIASGLSGAIGGGIRSEIRQVFQGGDRARPQADGRHGGSGDGDGSGTRAAHRYSWSEFCMAMSMEPRSLNISERSLLEEIFSGDFFGAAELRRQLDRAKVVSQWGVDSVSVDIEIEGNAVRSPLGSGVVPLDVNVLDRSGELVGEILVWVGDGFLSALEYAWYGEDPPHELPDPGSIVVTAR